MGTVIMTVLDVPGHQTLQGHLLDRYQPKSIGLGDFGNLEKIVHFCSFSSF